MTGIYIHIPFCAKKCPYCDFFSQPYRPRTVQLYAQAVCRNISALEGEGISADTIYFGGGTPSLMTAEQIGGIITAVQNSVQLISPEITLEANPAALTEKKLCELREAGVNRLSIGVQSADDGQLAYLGRIHDFKRARKAVLDASAEGFENISCDLILGVKGQDEESLNETLDQFLALPIDHLSAYMLQIELGTAFDCEKVRAETADDEIMSALYLQLCRRMAAAGWEHYEISSWCRPGARSKHNMKYWTLEPYIGIGAGAHSYFGGVRYSCPRDTDLFINSFRQVREHEEQPDLLQEYVMLSLRLSDGLDISRLAEFPQGKRLIEKINTAIIPVIRAGLAVKTARGYALTENGFLVSNAVISELLL